MCRQSLADHQNAHMHCSQQKLKHTAGVAPTSHKSAHLWRHRACLLNALLARARRHALRHARRAAPALACIAVTRLHCAAVVTLASVALLGACRFIRLRRRCVPEREVWRHRPADVLGIVRQLRERRLRPRRQQVCRGADRHVDEELWHERFLGLRKVPRRLGGAAGTVAGECEGAGEFVLVAAEDCRHAWRELNLHERPGYCTYSCAAVRGPLGRYTLSTQTHLAVVQQSYRDSASDWQPGIAIRNDDVWHAMLP